MLIPREYILQKFYQFAGYPQYKKHSNTYIAGCPICREGRSWGKKRRCIYIVEDNAVCCHNCGWYSDAIKWIQEVSGQSFNEILNESREFDILPLDVLSDKTEPIIRKLVEDLPKDSINLFDSKQVEFYSDNQVVQDALSLIKRRRIDRAINRPETLWLSLNDHTHKNRVVIPFYNENNNIIFYQSRALYDRDLRLYPKYLSKINGEKSLYNINKITSDIDYIFIFEGPIDSFFIKNGTAVAGIQENSNAMFSKLQEMQLNTFKFHKKIWVLDNQWVDNASRNKTNKLIESGECVFIWPENLGKKYKDMNDLCIDQEKDSLDIDFIVSNSFTDMKAKLLMSVIGR